MPRHIRSKDGKFAGSLGTKTPPASPAVPDPAALSSTDPCGTVPPAHEVYARYQAAASTGADPDSDAAAPDPQPTRPTTLAEADSPARAWDPDDPIWPKREDVEAVLDRNPAVTTSTRAGFTRAFRAIYQQAWCAAFTAAPPSNDEDGWATRRDVLARTVEDFTDAQPIPARYTRPGMAVVGGHGIRLVESARAQDGAVDLYFAGGRADTDVPGEDVYIHLPRLDQRD